MTWLYLFAMYTCPFSERYPQQLICMYEPLHYLSKALQANQTHNVKYYFESPSMFITKPCRLCLPLNSDRHVNLYKRMPRLLTTYELNNIDFFLLQLVTCLVFNHHTCIYMTKEAQSVLDRLLR